MTAQEVSNALVGTGVILAFVTACIYMTQDSKRGLFVTNCVGVLAVAFLIASLWVK